VVVAAAAGAVEAEVAVVVASRRPVAVVKVAVVRLEPLWRRRRALQRRS